MAMTAPAHVCCYLAAWIAWEQGHAPRPSCFAWHVDYTVAAFVRWICHGWLVAAGQPHRATLD